MKNTEGDAVWSGSMPALSKTPVVYREIREDVFGYCVTR